MELQHYRAFVEVAHHPSMPSGYDYWQGKRRLVLLETVMTPLDDCSAVEYRVEMLTRWNDPSRRRLLDRGYLVAEAYARTAERGGLLGVARDLARGVAKKLFNDED